MNRQLSYVVAFVVLQIFSSMTISSRSTSHANEIGFVETFALAADRAHVLKQLIPGTQEYYYYHCLHYQNTQRYEQVEELLKAWIKRHGYNPSIYEIQNRQALLTYADDPEQALAYLRNKLQLRFDHKRQQTSVNPSIPTSLNQGRISWESLKARAYRNAQNTQDFEDHGLFRLASEKDLDPTRLRDLLNRTTTPDHPELVELVLKDLSNKYSKGFGSIRIHQLMTQSQLDSLIKQKPTLLAQTNFVNAYLLKLTPNPDSDWQNDRAVYQAYLDRLWEFASRLAPSFNSLKANILYHQLKLDRSLGTYDRDRFFAYIKLPRNVSYINPDYMKQNENRRYTVDLNASFTRQTTLQPIGSDEPLVASYLDHFFLKENSYAPYQLYIRDTYLKRRFAETKIVNGLGEPEKWYSLLAPAEYQALKDRVDIDFAHANPTYFRSDSNVSLDVHVKNVETLLVKVFEINTKNFYRQKLQEINTDVNLDGLVANQEQVLQYTEAPLLRNTRHFEFPQLNKPGVYVIDFIGNGKSSRALVRKGKFHHVVRTTVAGQLFSIYDEDQNRVPDAKLWMAGKEYSPNEKGMLIVPFTNRPTEQKIVLTSGEFSSLSSFRHQSEAYALDAGIYVDRESLTANNKTNVLIRTALKLNGIPVPADILENSKLTIRSTDLEGVDSTKQIDDFELHADRDSVYEFSVPERLASISFQLSTEVKNLSQGKTQNLSVAQSYTVNQIDKSSSSADMHFSRSQEVYLVDVLGKTGESLPNRQVNFAVKHRDFRSNYNFSLRTDERGRIRLGPLKEISYVTATGPQGVNYTWHTSGKSK